MLRVAIVGIGGRGGDLLEGLLTFRDQVQVVAFCDPNPVRMKAAADYYAIQLQCYTDIPSMLAKEKLSGAIVTSPDVCHEANAVALLKGGVDILIEKPLAPTVRAARNILSVAERSGRKVTMGFNLRQHGAIIKMKELIAAGEIGSVYLIENREFYDGGRTYFGRWNGTYSKSGGLWLHKGSHDFDVFHYLMNFPRPLRVSSFAGMNVFRPDRLPFALRDGVKPGPSCRHCPYQSECPDCNRYGAKTMRLFGDEASAADGYNRDGCIYLSDQSAHDNGFAMVEYENGARAMHMECFGTSISDRRYTVVGIGGQLEASTSREQEVILRKRFDREREIRFKLSPEAGHHGGADLRLLKEFLQALSGEAANTASLEQGLWATAVGEAAEISRREGRTVNIDEIMKN